MARVEAANIVFCFKTSFGWAALIESAGMLRQVRFGYRSAALAMGGLDPQLTARSVPADDEPPLVERLKAFIAGTADDFRDVPIDLGFASVFQRRVIQRCRRIPYGKTLGYGQLAAAVGSPGAARAVGNVMATNRYPLIVPCHRVVNSDGSLGNYSGPDGIKMKARLLALESANANSPITVS